MEYYYVYSCIDFFIGTIHICLFIFHTTPITTYAFKAPTLRYVSFMRAVTVDVMSTIMWIMRTLFPFMIIVNGSKDDGYVYYFADDVCLFVLELLVLFVPDEL